MDNGSGQAHIFTAYVEWDPETQLHVGMVPEIPGAHTQAASLDELRLNLKEVLELLLDEGVAVVRSCKEEDDDGK